MADNINFLQGIPIPQLGGGFAQQFTDFCNAVKNNFERLISIQYTKGNDGNSVEAKELIIDRNLDPTDKLSVLGYGLVSTIFGDGAFKGDNGETEADYHDGINDPWQGTLTKEQIQIKLEGDPEDPTIKPIAPVFTFDDTQDPGGHHSIPQILNDNNEGFKVNVVVDDHNGKAYLAIPYVFIDGRIEDLNHYIKNHANTDDTYKNFYDFSTVIYGVAEYNEEEEIENWKWTLWRNDLVPKLYFDDNANEFCWQVNGQQTGVTAQGIKGDDGYTPQAFMALGSRDGDTITIQQLQVVDAGGNVEYTDRNNTHEPILDNTNNVNVWSLIWKEDPIDPNNNIVIRNIDFVLVFYGATNHTNEDTGNPPRNFAFLGRPVIASDGVVTITCESNRKDDIFDAIDKQVLRDYLNNIYNWNNGGTHYADLRGLYIPACPPVNDVSIRDKAHMTYSDRDLDPNGWTKLRTSPVLMDKTHSSQTSEPWAESGKDVGDWRIDYNLNIVGGVDIGGSLSVQGNINTQGNLGVQGNTIIQGGLTVGGDTYLQGNITVQGQLTAQGASFRPIKDTHMAVISKFKDTRCEMSRSVQHRPLPGAAILGESYIPKGITYNTKLSTTLNIKIGRISKIQGLQGASGDLAWDSGKNINTILHNEIAMYGCQANYIAQNNTQGMWYEGNEGTQSAITTISERLTQNQERHNAPKMYDVIEYNIPITLAKILDSYVDCCAHFANQSYSVQYDVLDTTKARSVGPLDFDKGGLCEPKENGDAFNTPSFRFQEYSIGQDNPADALYVCSTISGETVYAQGAISALKNKFTGFVNNFHGIQGDLDYMGTPIHYNIDFYIRIFEAAAVQQDIAANCNVNTTFTILPVGYISFVEDGYTYRAPIYGGISVKNYLPSTMSNMLFAKVSSTLTKIIN